MQALDATSVLSTQLRCIACGNPLVLAAEDDMGLLQATPFKTGAARDVKGRSNFDSTTDRSPDSEVYPHAKTIQCVECGTSIAGQEGVLEFAPNLRPPKPLPDTADMQRINQVARERGWYTAVTDHFRDAPGKIAYISDPVRLGWLFHCLDKCATDACLCLGSDWGSLVFPLSRFFKTVYSVDDDVEKLRFQAIRAADESVKNLRILHAPSLQLPLADNSVDLVSLSGTLEGIGNSDLSRTPKELQEALLKEVRRVLKPGGVLYLGIENR